MLEALKPETKWGGTLTNRVTRPAKENCDLGEGMVVANQNWGRILKCQDRVMAG